MPLDNTQWIKAKHWITDSSRSFQERASTCIPAGRIDDEVCGSSPSPFSLIPTSLSTVQVPTAESDAGNGPGPDAGAPEPAAHGWQEADGGGVTSY